MSDSLEKARAWLTKHGLAFREETEGGELVHLDEDLKAVIDQVRAEAREEAARALKQADYLAKAVLEHKPPEETVRNGIVRCIACQSLAEKYVAIRALGSGAPSDATEETTP